MNMTWNYHPITKAEADAGRYKLLEAGDYEFFVESYEEKLSKAGNSMIVLVLEVYDKKGVQYKIIDRLICTDAMEWKTRHFCDAVGLASVYDSGRFKPAAVKGRRGKAKFFVKRGKEKDDGSGELYPDRTEVREYLPMAGTASTEKADVLYQAAVGMTVQKAGGQSFNDDIPFQARKGFD